MNTRISLPAVGLVCGLAWALISNTAHAQFLGHNLAGDYGLTSGSQPPPGSYLSAVYLRYDGEKLRDRNGNNIGSDPERRGELDVNGYAVGWWQVTDYKLFGGNYSFLIFPAFTDNKLEIPILGQEQKVSTGLTDLYFQPINLGWNTDRADFVAGVGIFAPTGRYDADADDNLGLGMWSFEFFAGTTLYLDQAKTWNLATTAFYEIHTEKEGTDIRVGDILTLEGGIGKSFMDGAINVGVAYYAQWKITDDDLGGFVPPSELNFVGKNRGFGVGPEINLPLATGKTLFGFLNLRYFWESGNRSTVEGQTFVATLTFPIPSVPLQ
jgi:hypothetical protein